MEKFTKPGPNSSSELLVQHVCKSVLTNLPFEATKELRKLAEMFRSFTFHSFDPKSIYDSRKSSKLSNKPEVETVVKKLAGAEEVRAVISTPIDIAYSLIMIYEYAKYFHTYLGCSINF